MSIDWSKAPVGTIGRGTVGEFLPVWIGSDWYEHDRESGGRYFFADVGVPVTAWRRADVTNYLARPTESTAWTGTGLPPVGTVCEIQHGSLGWTRCEIVAHKVMPLGCTLAIAWIDADTLDQSQGIRFRPIRTQEQIEAEEREKAIREMASEIAGYMGYDDPRSSDVGIAAYLHDHNYRKHPKEDT